MEKIQLTSFDGTMLHGVHDWPATDTPLGAVTVVHGLGEHGGRYGFVAESLVSAGYAVLAWDQRGHGLSPGRRGHAISAVTMAKDAMAALEWLTARWPGLPLFLYGHSMGGGAALSAALRFRPGLAGLILTSPWLALAFKPPVLKELLGRAVGLVVPELTVSAGLGGGAMYRNGEMQAADAADPLLHGRISVGTYVSVMKEGRRSVAHAAEWDRPALILHGTEDGVTSLEASREAAGRMGETCRFIAWEGGLHELHNDVGRYEVMKTITAWMSEVRER